MKKQKLQGIGEPKETTGMSNKRSYTTVMRYAVAAKNVSDSFLEHGNTAAKSQNSIKMSPQMQMSSLMKFALYLNDSLKNSIWLKTGHASKEQGSYSEISMVFVWNHCILRRGCMLFELKLPLHQGDQLLPWQELYDPKYYIIPE